MRTRIALLAMVLSASALAQETSTGASTAPPSSSSPNPTSTADSAPASTDAALEALIEAGMKGAAALKLEAAAIDPAVRALLAPAVTGWITSTRDLAIERGVTEIPRDIRALLSDSVPAEILDRVRWRVDDSMVSLQQSLFRMAYTSAVTLDDVVLFATEDDAADPALWAHEIYHVMQYSDWGVEGFVGRYLADFEAVEQEAWDFRWQWRESTAGGPAE
jgi:hypothetical protein